MVRSRSYLEIRGGSHRSDLSVWPNPADPEEIEWKLRHTRSLGGEVENSTLMVAASYMNAYRALIDLPQKARNQRIEQIKQAMRAIDTKEKP